MPDKPSWTNKINEIAYELEMLPESHGIDSTRLQVLLGVSPRQAQDILKPIVTTHQGKRGLARVDRVIQRLQELAGVDPGEERDRRAKFANWFRQTEFEFQVRPRLTVAVPARMLAVVTGSDLDSIPGLELSPGHLELSFRSPEEARLKLLALGMAMGRDEEGFDARVGGEEDVEEECCVANG